MYGDGNLPESASIDEQGCFGCMETIDGISSIPHGQKTLIKI